MTRPFRAEVIAIGDELTSGQRLDTNSQWISTELGLLGVPVVFHTTVADTLAAGVEAFRIACGRADVVVATGGLGPTADDLTRDVLAAVSNAPLEPSLEALKDVESRFATRKALMTPSNRRQALFPRGSRIIPNPEGTAPGIDLDVDRPGGGQSRVFALPGVPVEMRTMWRGSVAECIMRMHPEAGVIIHRRIKCFGAGESAIEAMLPNLIDRDRIPLVGITAHEATITLRITARGPTAADCLAAIAPTEETIRAGLGQLVYGIDDDEVEDAVIHLLHESQQTLATLEIGTAGRVAEFLAGAEMALSRNKLAPIGQLGQPTQNPSAATAACGGYCGGIVLPDSLLSASALAEQARTTFNTTLGLAVGILRPAPEGRMAVDIAIASESGTEQIEHLLGGGESLAMSRAAKTAINLLRLGGSR